MNLGIPMSFAAIIIIELMIKICYPFLKKAIVTGLVLFTFINLSFSQQMGIIWAKQAGGNEGDNCTDIFVAPDGSIYSSGVYTGNAQFGSFGLQAQVGIGRGYISKSDANGTVLWAKNFGSGVVSIAPGPQGTLYVSGNFMGTENFGGISLTASGPNYDLYVLKINANGDVLWAKNFQGVSSNSMVSDASGNIYMGGTFALSATFGNITISQPPQVSTYDVYLAKLDPNGTPVWAQKYGGTYSDYFSGLDIDANGNIYVTGTFIHSTTIGVENITAYGYGIDIFVFKTNASGTVVWAKQFGGYNIDGVDAIAVDNQGNSYVTGACRETYQFGAFSATSTNFSAYLCKIDPAGTPLWMKSYLEHELNQTLSSDVAIDHEGNIYTSGNGGTGYTFDAQNSINIGAAYVLKRDSNGNLLSAISTDNQQEHGGYGTDLDVDLTGNVYLGGSFSGTIHTNPILQTNPNNFNYDAFLMKIGACSVNAATTQNGNTLTATATGASYQWIDCANANTPIAGATAQSFTATANGTYAVIVTQQNGCSATSSCVTVSNATTGLEDLTKDLFAVYPNPNAGVFKVMAESQVTVRINDATGKLVSMQTLKPGENIIELAHVKSGIYFITATDSDGKSNVQRINIIK
jgi:hypothetical protein